MKIVKQMIDEVSDPRYTLTDVLIRAKVLAHKLQSHDLTTWVDSELNGYNKSQPLPEYRILKGMIVGIIETSTERISNFNYPLALLEDDTRRALETFNARHSISTLQEIVTSVQPLALYEIIAHDTYHFLSQYIGNVSILELRRQIDKSGAVQIITAVKSKLLDFLLKLDDEIGPDESLGGGHDRAIVSSLFNSAVLGDHATIIVGNNNYQVVSKTAVSSFEDVRRRLIEQGIHGDDVAELEFIIDDDNRDDVHHQIGDKVKTWISSMLLKAMDGSWQIGLGAAGDLLSGLIKQYYGWPS